MSDAAYVILGIVEGPTDAIVLQAVAAAVLGTPRIVWTTLQPETSLAFQGFGKHGGGWFGVRRKCREIGASGGIGGSGILVNADALIIHVDGEVAGETEMNLARPCPPPDETVDTLRKEIWSWLGSAPEARVVLAIPMTETEAWLVPGMRPNAKLLPSIECAPKPSAVFKSGKPRLVEQSGKKRRPEYEAQREAIRAAWPAARSLVTALRFERDLAAAIRPSSGHA